MGRGRGGAGSVFGEAWWRREDGLVCLLYGVNCLEERAIEGERSLNWWRGGGSGGWESDGGELSTAGRNFSGHRSHDMYSRDTPPRTPE